MAHAEEVKAMRENAITEALHDSILKKLNLPVGAAVVGTANVNSADLEALKKETEDTKASL